MCDFFGNQTKQKIAMLFFPCLLDKIIWEHTEITDEP